MTLKNDNFRPVSDRKLARAALAFMEDVEAGTAIIPLPRAGGLAVGRGERIVYRSLSGEAYDAVITAVRDEHTVDIVAFVPGCAEPVHLTRIRFQAREAT